MRNKNFYRIIFILASIGISIGVIKPNSVAEWIVSITIVAPTIWYVFVEPDFIHRWRSRRYIYVSWFINIANLALVLFIMLVAAPYLSTVLSEWLEIFKK